MRTLIVDDEPLARARLASLLGDCGEVTILGEAGDGRTAVELCARLAPELVLLDIDMPLMDGLEAARHLATFETAPAVIFCTAYDEHALTAFEVNAVDYLVKPIRLERLRSALARVRRLHDRHPQKPSLVNARPARRTHLCVRVRGNLVLVPVGEVDYFLAEDKYVVVHYGRNDVLIEEPLKALEAEFGDQVVRIHRNCLVARSHIASLVRLPDERIFARIAGSDTQLEVSRRNLPAVRKLLKGMS